MSIAEVIPFRPQFALITEANHRVANHLSLLAGLVQAQASHVGQGPAQLPREEVQGMLREVAGKVVGVGQLHRRLADLAHDQIIELGAYLIESSHAMVKSLSLQDRVGIVHRLETRCPARAEQVQPVTLIVGEIIMNAVKHAHPTGIAVQISIYCGRTASGRVLIEVEDDGVGFPENFDPRHGGGVGLKLIRQLAASLH
ncbi:MAG: sensor histidine kinase, partial [Alphaproteobacteria bacterium]|nr:sensor histidine kinase [Alphaproteobacteria bacterium]